MSPQASVVVTSISGPNAVLRDLAKGCAQSGASFYVIGDEKSPLAFQLDSCTFLSIADQLETGFATAAACPRGHYARKNIGYLVSLRGGGDLIVETDDDNYPRASFWEPRRRLHQVRAVYGAGWVNAYAYFSHERIWPRGLPLDAIQNAPPPIDTLPFAEVDCPIQQGLADENPDVDAVYRLILPLPVRFSSGRVALRAGSWCPFNSQNTTWWPDAFPLLYLPAYCSFRMTDIWRSFVAQRICWANSWSVLFHEATVWQERNEHSLMRDFQDEVPGYLHNRRIAETLEDLTIAAGCDSIPANLRLCYEALIRLGVIGQQELRLLEAWLGDLAGLHPLR